MTGPRCEECHRPLLRPSPDRLGPKCRAKLRPAPLPLIGRLPRHPRGGRPYPGQTELDLETQETQVTETDAKNTPPRDRLAEGLLSMRQTALLLGVSEHELRAEHDRQRAADPSGSGMRLPKQWIRQGKEIAARLGTDSLEEALRLLEKEQVQ